LDEDPTTTAKAKAIFWVQEAAHYINSLEMRTAILSPALSACPFIIISCISIVVGRFLTGLFVDCSC
jgi:hypothetical protein